MLFLNFIHVSQSYVLLIELRRHERNRCDNTGVASMAIMPRTTTALQVFAESWAAVIWSVILLGYATDGAPISQMNDLTTGVRREAEDDQSATLKPFSKREKSADNHKLFTNIQINADGDMTEDSSSGSSSSGEGE